ncbi:hypothetical protein, partial [Deferribacter abyssi]|uniref:hypothetical protein n=1 Tax=Deferribacter abyssi TaxID=213806 RepID=UPI003C153139
MKIIKETIPFCQCLYRNQEAVKIGKTINAASKVYDEDLLTQITNKVFYSTLFLVESGEVKFPPPLSENLIRRFYGIGRYRRKFMMGYHIGKKIYEKLIKKELDDNYFCGFCTKYEKIPLDNYMNLLKSQNKILAINKILKEIDAKDEGAEIFILKHRSKSFSSDDILFEVGYLKMGSDTLEVYKAITESNKNNTAKQNIALMAPGATALAILLIFDRYIHNNIHFPFKVSHSINSFEQDLLGLDFLRGLFIPPYDFFPNKNTYSSRNIQNWPLLLFSDKLGFSNKFTLKEFGISVSLIKTIVQFLKENGFKNYDNEITREIFTEAKKRITIPDTLNIKNPYEGIFNELELASDLRVCTCKVINYVKYKPRIGKKEPKTIILTENNGENIEISLRKLKDKIKLSKLQNRELFSERRNFGYLVGLFSVTLRKFPDKKFIKIGFLGVPIAKNFDEKIKEEMPWLLKNRYNKDIKANDYLIAAI